LGYIELLAIIIIGWKKLKIGVVNMASPRIFVSSTCYDLFDIRNNLYNFINNYEFDPIMSEFGDIFFDFKNHVQDSCINEIKKCQMFILIIGNQYGSSYYKVSNQKNPDSVTMSEFKMSLELGIPKYIFINKLVKYDYDNYVRFLEREYTQYFKNNKVENVEKAKNDIREEFDSNYMFPKEQYKHIFKFIDIINSLSTNNAILTFETSEDIQVKLKKQWANFFCDALQMLISEENKRSSEAAFNELLQRTMGIESKINSLIKGENNSLSIDTNRLINELTLTNLEKMQSELTIIMQDILYNSNSEYSDDMSRGYFDNQLSEIEVSNWLGSLNKLVEEYKWAQWIPFKILFKELSGTGYSDEDKIPYTSVLKLTSLYTKNIEEQSNITKAVKIKLDEIVKMSNNDNSTISDDEIPF
jgi:hypothetical protein